MHRDVTKTGSFASKGYKGKIEVTTETMEKMKNRVIKALVSPIVVVFVCLFAAATCFALSNDVVMRHIGIGYDKIKPSKELTTKVYSITDKYDEIEVNRGVKVVYQVVAGTPSAEVTAPDNLIDHVEVSVRKGTLVITIEEGVQISGSLNTTVTVSGPAIKEYSVSSAGQIFVESAINVSGKIDLDASSAGRIEFFKEIKAKEVSIEASSASKIITASIVSDDVEIEASSAANVSINKVKGAKCEVETSSASSVSIEGCELGKLDASASSASKISVSGKAYNATLDASSGASVGGNDLTVKNGAVKRKSSGGRVTTK